WRCSASSTRRSSQVGASVCMDGKQVVTDARSWKPRPCASSPPETASMYDFTGKTVVVTGGSMGIGAAFADELARRKARLVLVARSEDKLRAVAAELTRAHRATVDVIAADLARPGAATQVFQAVRALGLEVDVLINN